MNTPKQILTELKQQLNLLKSLNDEYEGKIKGNIYTRRLSIIQSRIGTIGKKLERLGKFTIKVYNGEFENGNNFEYLFDASVPEEEVITYLEFLQLSPIKWYRIKTIIKTGEIIFTRKNKNT